MLFYLDPAGNGASDLLYSTYVGGAFGESLGTPILVPSQGNTTVVVSGNSTSPDFPTTAGSFQPMSGGLNDGVVLQLELNPHVYCPAAPNSSSPEGAFICGTGSVVIADNALTLSVTGLPTNQFGYFLMSEIETQFPVGQGFICLGSPVIRFNQNVLNSGAMGTVSFPVDMNNLPQGTVFDPGDTWRFQLWYRDNNPGPTSNFSNALAVTFH